MLCSRTSSVCRAWEWALSCAVLVFLSGVILQSDFMKRYTLRFFEALLVCLFNKPLLKASCNNAILSWLMALMYTVMQPFLQHGVPLSLHSFTWILLWPNHRENPHCFSQSSFSMQEAVWAGYSSAECSAPDILVTTLWLEVSPISLSNFITAEEAESSICKGLSTVSV